MERKSNLQKEYFDHILAGRKTIEGRPVEWLTKDGNDTKVGDFIKWKCGSVELTVKIIAIVPADDFGELFNLFGEKLLPGVKTAGEAEEVYRQWYKDDCKVVGLVLKL
jgi:ASC-1-like (ASCH) protein